MVGRGCIVGRRFGGGGSLGGLLGVGILVVDFVVYVFPVRATGLKAAGWLCISFLLVRKNKSIVFRGIRYLEFGCVGGSLPLCLGDWLHVVVWFSS